ncbi:hypothetical protein PanWU01x14_068960 [Parasponia andersonii]|uniref:Uncharacterized protein n=1 Tax=Parasponia andersonii TaxID=3476 RepID=A0A2P5DFI4_PARAD|nr:hypothetical protein PanWU01x14_068960 [Parasponia andersonii]
MQIESIIFWAWRSRQMIRRRSTTTRARRINTRPDRGGSSSSDRRVPLRRRWASLLLDTTALAASCLGLGRLGRGHVARHVVWASLAVPSGIRGRVEQVQAHVDVAG